MSFRGHRAHFLLTVSYFHVPNPPFCPPPTELRVQSESCIPPAQTILLLRRGEQPPPRSTARADPRPRRSAAPPRRACSPSAPLSAPHAAPARRHARAVTALHAREAACDAERTVSNPSSLLIYTANAPARRWRTVLPQRVDQRDDAGAPARRACA